MSRIIEGPLGPEKTEDGDFIAGRYSIIDDPEDIWTWIDLHTDFFVEIFLAGQWIPGYIRHTSDAIYSIEYPKGLYHGYFFESALDKSRCGLCFGMRVRVVRSGTPR